MSAVEVEIADEPRVGPAPDGRDEGENREEPRQKRVRPTGGEIEVEREITKRQLIQSISTIVVVVLYMVFTLLRDRDAGVVVVDPSESDDWDGE